MPARLIGFRASWALEKIGYGIQIKWAANSRAVFMMATGDQHQPFRLICRSKKTLAHKEGHDVVSRAVNEEDGNVDFGTL